MATIECNAERHKISQPAGKIFAIQPLSIPAADQVYRFATQGE
ncbi:hypothetical protein [Erwinia sp. E_sp_W01_6]